MRRLEPSLRVADRLSKRVGVTILVLALSVVGVARLPSSEVAAASSRAFLPSLRSSSDWLGELNYYRVAAGLAPVSENTSLEPGILAHLTYLEDTPSSYLQTPPYQSMHTENPASPYYTPAGAYEASMSNLMVGWPSYTNVQFIDGWLTAPFHALGMLRPELTQVGFAAQNGAAGLGVGSMAGFGHTITSPVLFPGPGMTTDLTEFSGGESPSPLPTCGWTTDYHVGLPLIAMLTQAPSATLTATLTAPDGSVASSGGELCLVDANTYVNADPVYGMAGLSSLLADNAVILIPNTPLVAGTYTASISQPGMPNLSWSFTVKPQLAITNNANLPWFYDGLPTHYALSATGGTGTYIWAITSGSLPKGLTLTPSGVITGTGRIGEGFFIVSVMVRDAQGGVTTPFVLHGSVAPAPGVVTHRLAEAVRGVRYHQVLQWNGGGLGDPTWLIRSGRLPPGLSLLAATGLIAGTPTTAGSYALSVTYEDAQGTDAPTVRLVLKVVTRHLRHR